MLIRFNVRNFLSFSARDNGSTEEFSMIAGKVRSKTSHIYDVGKMKLLKFAAVYGANAAGKSNLVKAMYFMRRVVLNGLPDGHTEMYCKADPDNKDRASYFEVEIVLGKKYYAYGFEVILSQSRFISEWLIELQPDNREKPLFCRNMEAGTYEIGGELSKNGLKQKLDVYAGDVRDDTSVLFLMMMNQNKRNLYQSQPSATVLKDVFAWIDQSFDINYPDHPVSNYMYLSKTDNVNEICRMMAAFGTGITDFQMVDVPVERVLKKFPKFLREQILSDIEQHQVLLRNNKNVQSAQMAMRSSEDFFVITIDNTNSVRCQTIEFNHGRKNVLFRLDEESDGTIRLLDLLEILVMGEGKTYVIDELDRCLHPSLTYKFVDTFLQLAAGKRIQLLVTTHESRLMDFDLLRRDEIWFIDKKSSGESNIYSLEEYNARFDQKIDKAYLEGRYGGVPIFSTVFPLEG